MSGARPARVWRANTPPKAVGENSSGAAGQPEASFGLSKLDEVRRSAGVQKCSSTPPPPQTQIIIGRSPRLLAIIL